MWMKFGMQIYSNKKWNIMCYWLSSMHIMYVYKALTWVCQIDAELKVTTFCSQNGITETFILWGNDMLLQQSFPVYTVYC